MILNFCRKSALVCVRLPRQTTITRGLRLHKERTVRHMYWRGRSFDKIQYPERKRSDWQEWNYRSEIFAFSRRIHENLSEDTLRQLFTHSSYIDRLELAKKDHNLPDQNITSNGEFIDRGDKLMDKHIKPYLRYHFDQMPEDGIVDITNYLKSDPVLAEISDWLGCRDLILADEFPILETTKAATAKALLAAIEKDLGSSRVQRFVNDMIISYLEDKDILDDVWDIPHPRETLNLILKNSQLPTYEPRLMFQTSVDTLEPCHLVGLYVDKKYLSSSAGETLAIAEDCAALNSLARIFDLTNDRKAFVYGEESEKIDYSKHLSEHEYISTWKISSL